MQTVSQLAIFQIGFQEEVLRSQDMHLGARLRGRTATQRSKKGSENREELKGQTKWDKWVSAIFCGFLRKSVASCGFLRKSAPPKCCNFQKKRKSAKLSENLRSRLRLSRLVCPF